MRRLIPAIAVVLLATACGSADTPAAAPSPSLAITTTVPAVASPTATAASGSPSFSPGVATPAPSRTAAGQLAVAIPAGQLPYKPAAGAPALDDVSITKSAADPCGIPADDSGNEAQLIDAEKVGPVLVVSFEFTNPCAASLAYDFTVTQAIGSATGPSGGPNLQTTTSEIGPQQSISFKVNVDPAATLTPAQLKQLWVGVTHIAKHSAG
jgi:hypothetical protein